MCIIHPASGTGVTLLIGGSSIVMSFVSCFLLSLRIGFGQQSSVGEEPVQHQRCMWLGDFDGTCDTVQSVS